MAMARWHVALQLRLPKVALGALAIRRKASWHLNVPTGIADCQVVAHAIGLRCWRLERVLADRARLAVSRAVTV